MCGGVVPPYANAERKRGAAPACHLQPYTQSDPGALEGKTVTSTRLCCRNQQAEQGVVQKPAVWADGGRKNCMIDSSRVSQFFWKRLCMGPSSLAQRNF